MEMRIVGYRPLGERVGVLPDVLSATLTVPVADIPTVEMTYPAGDGGVRGELLDSEVEIAVEMSATGAADGWFEPPGARFLSLTAESNALGDGTDARSLDAVHVSHVLSEALVWDVPASAQDSEGKWSFLSVSAGVILRTLWDAAVARGWGRGLTLDCTQGADSSGAPWASVVTLAFEKAVTLETVVESLVNLGMIDVQWQGRVMRVFNADTVLAPRWRTLWPLYAGTTSAPESLTWQDLCTHVLVKGDEGNVWRIANPEAPAGMRRIEKVVEAGGVTLEATARLVAQATLRTGASPAQEVVREWTDGDAVLLPWVDYRPGDWMRVQRAAGVEEMRVAQVSVTWDDSGLSGHVTFGTHLDDYLSRMAKKTKGVVGAASTSGAGVRPAPAGRETLTPDRPQGLVLSSSSVMTETGELQAVLNIAWAAVTWATNGVALTPSGYVVHVTRVRDDGVVEMAGPGSWEVSGTEAAMPALNGYRYRVKVRAMNDGRAGLWSDQQEITVTVEDEAPPAPSRPSVSSVLGVLTVKWDGTMPAGGQAPADVEACEVSVVAPGLLPEQVSEIGGRTGGSVQVAATAGGDYDVALRLRDRGGHRSEWTQAVRAVAESAIDSDTLERILSEGDLLNNVARAAAAEQTNGLTAGLVRMAAMLAPGTGYPPDDGAVGVTMWVSPGDGKVWRLTSKP